MKKRRIETEAVHFSERFGEKGSMNVPIYQNSTYQQKSPGIWEEFTYARVNNPTEEALRKSIAGLENAAYAVIFGSGLAAIGAVMDLFSPGDHIVSSADIYGGTQRLFSRVIEKRGVEFSFVETSDIGEIERAIKPNTKLIYVETPSNPLLSITDLRAVSAIAKAKGILFAVDSSMATPIFQRPLDLGADMVIHSLSKYISGHTNVIGGAVAANDPELLEQIKFVHKATGAVPGPFDCFLTMLGIKTLPLRMKQHQENAQRLVSYLKEHPKVVKVYYPGLPEHPQHALAKSQMSGFGGILSFDLDGDIDTARRFIEALELFPIAVSFGSVTSIVSSPASMSHKEMPREERIRRGFADSLIRISAGIEHIDDLLEDVGQALAKA